MQTTTLATSATGGPPVVPMQIVGPSNLTQHLENPRFRTALSGLLSEVGITGALVPVQVRACRIIPGTTHTQGLTLQTPDNHSVQLAWHDGDNGQRVQIRITTPRLPGLSSRMTPVDFHGRLQAAAERLKVRKEKAAKQAQPSANGHATANGASAAAPASSSPASDLPLDDGVTDLLVEALVSKKAIDSRGRVTRRMLKEVLEAPPFDISPVGPAFDWLISHQHFFALENDPDFLGLSQMWRTKYHERIPKPPAAASSVSAPVSAAAKTPATPAAPKPASASARARESAPKPVFVGGRAKLLALTTKVAEAEKLRADLATLEKEREPIKKKYDRAKERLDALDAKKAAIVEVLEAPDMKQAEKDLADLEQQLGIGK